MRKFLLATLLLVAALLLAMTFLQTEIIFPTRAVPPPGLLPPGAERLEVGTADGHRLHGVHIPPSTPSSGPRLLILGLAGNAWNGQDAAAYLHQTYPEAHIVGFHYRGYRPSTGTPSANALLADAPLVHDLAVEHVGPERTVAVGFSIGSGVAAALGRDRRLDGLILVTPFDSLKAVASGLYPWLPIGPFFQHELATADYLHGSHTPVAIIAAGEDELIPAKRTNALRREVSSLVYDRIISNAGHNDIYQRAEFQASMREALAAVSAGGGKR